VPNSSGQRASIPLGVGSPPQIPTAHLVHFTAARVSAFVSNVGSANGGRLLEWVSANDAGHVGWKALTNTRGAQNWERDATGDSRRTVVVTSENLPPVSTRRLALCFPPEHESVDRVGDVSIPIRA